MPHTRLIVIEQDFDIPARAQSGRIKTVTEAFAKENILHNTDAVGLWDFMLLNRRDDVISLENLIRTAEDFGWYAANVEQLIAYTEMCIVKNPIVAMGSTFYDEGKPRTVCVNMIPYDGLTIDMVEINFSWPKVYQFLMVRRVED